MLPVTSAFSAPQNKYFHTTTPKYNIISGALDDIVAEEKEDEQEFFEEKVGQDFAKGKRRNAKGSLKRYSEIIFHIRGEPLDVRKIFILKYPHPKIIIHQPNFRKQWTR